MEFEFMDNGEVNILGASNEIIEQLKKLDTKSAEMILPNIVGCNSDIEINFKCD